MKRYKTHILFLFCLFFGFILPVTVTATPVVYTYIGNSFDTFVDHNPQPAGSYDSTNHLEIVLTTIDGFLPDNTALVDISSFLDSWAITDRRYSATESSSYRDYRIEAVVSSNLIVSWYIAFWYKDGFSDPGAVGTIGTRMVSNGYYSGSTYGDQGYLYYWHSPGNYQFDSGMVSTVGTWRMNAAPIPEPATMILLGVGLVSLEGVIRRKLKK